MLKLPAWVSLLVGCVAFAGMRWILPAMWAGNLYLKSIAAGLQAIAWMPLLVFGFVGLIAFATAKAGKAVENIDTGKRPRFKREPLNPPSGSTLDNRWGASNQTIDEAIRGKGPSDAWSVEALRSLEWKRFELLCAKYYEAVGFKSETIRCGADGGIDVKLFKHDPAKPLAVVQCKAWNARLVGVKEIRELLGVMTSEKVVRGVFITTGSYSKDALVFGDANPMQLLDGPGFVKKIQELSTENQTELLKFAFGGDYATPTCASCGIKMVKRDSKRGVFWGCRNYPRCKSKFIIREQ
ncbi:restriction endonuclease [Collimonas sp. OK607]|uniref:restriction endonuclease n=1 Tax=Collimonas sp. OK607 TaxID=1798194 RepID=UPI00147D4466|nr:restriction endonuclease [Collimonas sp. OK607]